MTHDPRYGTPSTETDGITIGGILSTVRRRWVPMLLVGFPVAASFAALAWVVLPAHYRAFATLRIAAREPRLVFDTAESGSVSDFQTYRKTQVAMIRGRYVLNAALRDPDIATMPIVRRQVDPVEWLEQELIVDSPTSPEILRIALEGDEPEQLALLVNSVRDAYLNEVVNVEQQQRRSRLADLERIYAETEEKVRSKEERLADLARSLGSGDSKALTIRQQMALEYFGQLQREYARVRFELMQEQVRRRSLGPGATEADPAASEVSTAGVDAGLVERIAILEALIARFERQVRVADHPTLKDYRRELDLLRARARATGSVTVDGRPVVEDRLVILARQEELLRNELEEYSTLVDEIGTGSFELETMKSDIDQVAHIAEKVGTEMETLRIELQSPPRVNPLEEAEVPTTRDSGKRLKLTVAVAIAGFLLVAGLFVASDVQSDHVADAGHMADRTGIPVLGSLPDATHGDLGGSERREALDSARNLLLHRAELARQQVLLVTAPTRAEAHSGIACDLAESLARSGRSTVLVDLDFRHPIVAGRFGVAGAAGLAEALSGRSSLASLLQWTSQPELAVVASAHDVATTESTIARSGPGPLFEQLRTMFDFVVVNAGPLLTDANSTIVARDTDAAVLAIRRDVSQVPRVREARGRLEVLGVSVIGAIVVGTGVSAELPTATTGATVPV